LNYDLSLAYGVPIRKKVATASYHMGLSRMWDGASPLASPQNVWFAASFEVGEEAAYAATGLPYPWSHRKDKGCEKRDSCSVILGETVIVAYNSSSPVT
jgi:hypothetical protein